MMNQKEAYKKYLDNLGSALKNAPGTKPRVQLEFDEFRRHHLPMGIEAVFYVRGILPKCKLWERIGKWFLKKAGYELIWPKE